MTDIGGQGRRSDVRRRESWGKDLKSEIGYQGSEAGCQRSDVRGRIQ